MKLQKLYFGNHKILNFGFTKFRIHQILFLTFISITLEQNKAFEDMKSYTLKINKKKYRLEVEEGTSLLWVLREHLGLTGTKYGCGIAACGVCAIHVNGDSFKACALTVETVSKGQEITTIEGLSKNNDHPLQKAWIKAQVPQCGYCQPGQIMHAATLLEKNPNPSVDEIKEHMNGNLCRCGTYLRIIKAIQLASESSLALRGGG